MKNRKARIPALLLALLLMLLPFTAIPAEAAAVWELDITTYNAVYIWTKTDGFEVFADGVSHYSLGYDTDSLRLTGSGSCEITVTDLSGGTNKKPVKVTLQNINNDVSSISGKAAFSMGAGTYVDLALVGANTLKSGANRAGLEVPEGAVLTVTAADDSQSLNAEGGAYGAGIGGEINASGGSITLTGGSITAKGGDHGAGIGSGAGTTTVGGHGGTILIDGGIIDAKGGPYGAGIGGGGGNLGTASAAGSITIRGGTVTATGGESPNGGAAGIGSSTDAADTGSITISGGNVTATGSKSAAGIGGGRGTAGGTIRIGGGVISATGGSTSTVAGGGIAISGGTIRAKGQSGGMDIGPGDKGAAGTVKITGGSLYPENGAARVSSPTNGGVTPVYMNTLTLSGDGINGIGDGIPVTTTLPGSCGVKDVSTMNGGVIYFWLPETSADETVAVQADSVFYGARWTRNTNPQTKTLSPYTPSILDDNLTITQYAADYTVAVGSTQAGRYPYSSSYTIKNYTGGNTVTVKDGSGGTNTRPVSIILENVNIDVSAAVGAAAFSLEAGTAANLTLIGASTLKSGENRAGLEAPENTTLRIGAADDSHSLEAHGGKWAAGIGGGNNSDGGGITLSGGSVKAVNGEFAAAIGGGNSSDGGSITISGGTVQAHADNGAKSGDAGIGGGSDGDGGSIRITGGTVSAVGGMGAGIGGGLNGHGGDIRISGGFITATGGTNTGAAGIGGGHMTGDGGNISISGGTVTARGQGIGMDIGQGGGFAGTVQITGGSVYPVNGGAKVSGPTGHGGTPVYLNTLTVGNPALADGIPVTRVTATGLSSTYGDQDIITLPGGIVYFWLPETSTANAFVRVTANTYFYKTNFTRPAGEAAATLLLFGPVGGSELAAGVDPGTAVYDHKTAGSLPVSLTMGSHSLERIFLDNRLLIEGLHYTVKSGTYSFRNSFLSTLTAGEYSITFKMTGGNDPALKLTVTGVHDCPGAGFTDVDTAQWYHTAVDFAVKNGIMRGVSPASFKPNGTLTRGMLITILHRAEGEPAALKAAGFTDITKGSWYYNAVMWGQENGIVKGYDAARFGPEDPLTREQMAAILDRYCKYKNATLPVVNSDTRFTDADAISGWARESVENMYCGGILHGKGGGIFDPKASSTRAQAAQLIMNFMEG